MLKSELAAALAATLNLLNDLDRDAWTNRQIGQLHTILGSIPEDVRSDFWHNGTILPGQLTEGLYRQAV